MKNKVGITIIFVLLIAVIALLFAAFIYKLDKKSLNEGFYLIGENEVTIEYGNKYDELGYVAIVNDTDYHSKVIVENNVDETKLGEYEVNYYLTIKRLNKTLTRKVKVVDNTKPEIKITGNKEVTCTVKLNDCVLPKYEATDNYDGNITKNVTIENGINNDKKGTYEVIYKVKDSSGNEAKDAVKVIVKDKFEHTYVNISISKQKLTYYVKDKAVLTTDVTTGKNNATKTGKFKIRNKVRNTYLTGKDYKSFVKYWMAYSGNNYGIHDASWRNKFGGKIYKTNGSHGCVNVPTDAAAKLYSMLEIGTPVYIKR